MNSIPNEQDNVHSSSLDRQNDDGRDLKFVAIDLGEETAGGWYRELPNAEIEVMSRAQLQRVPVTEADAETIAREKIAEIVGRRSPPCSADSS